jgi:hypothetical protein
MVYVSVSDAARHLGISEHAVRQRAYRGSLPSRHEGGRLLIGISRTQDAKTSRETFRKAQQDTQQDKTQIGNVPLIETVAATIDLLREQLTAKDTQIASLSQTVEEMRRDHAREVQELHVLLQNTQRLIPAIAVEPTTAQEERSPTRGTNVAPEGVQRAHEASEKVPEKPQRWPWWMRIFGGR